MDFLYTPILWGLAAASIPLIIHLLNRRRHRVVDWGAMQFLLASHASRNRRILLEEILLLAMRTLLLAILVAALARPLLKNPFFVGGGGTRQDVALVLDASMSMSAAPDGRSRFEMAKDAAVEAIDALRNGDTVSVLRASSTIKAMGTQEVVVGEATRVGLKNAVRPMTPLDGGLDMPRAIETAASMLAAAPNPYKQIVVITDAQAHGWKLGDNRRWTGLSGQFADSARRPRLRVLSVGGEAESISNLCVAELSIDRRVVGTDRPVLARATVTNTGATPISGAGAELVVDDQRVGSAQVPTLRPDASAQVEFVYQFQRPGSHVIGVRLQVSDHLAVDNAEFRAVEVRPSLPVLLVDGDRSDRPLGNETDYLAAALAPGHVVGLEPVDYLIDPVVVTPQELPRRQLDPARYKVVVLANVSVLPAGETARLHEYVRRGGGLLIAPGPSVRPADYQAVFATAPELMVGELGEPVGDADARKEFVSVVPGARHPAMRLASDDEQTDIANVRIYRRFSLADTQGGEEGPGRVRRLASLSSGQPLAVERRVGQGRVILSAVPLDIAWSNLPARRVYVVMMHEWIYYLCEPGLQKRNVTVGEELVISLPDEQVGRPDAVQIADPTGRTEPIAAQVQGRQVVFRVPQTDRPGVYRLVMPAGGEESVWHFVARLDPQESGLTPLGRQDREQLGKLAGASFFRTTTELRKSLTIDVAGREIWRWLALAAAALLLAEVLLTRRIASARHATGADRAEGLALTAMPARGSG